jgi:hypothetical protein
MIVVTRTFKKTGILLGAAFALGGCASLQMSYNVKSYDVAIARSANELLLLNAVRASQRYPMSFTQVGEVSTGPLVGGSLENTLNFTPFGLNTLSIAPKISKIEAGYSSFKLNNLNDGESLEKLREPIPGDIIDSFESSGWPKELVWMLYIRSVDLKDPKLKFAVNIDDIDTIHRRREYVCNKLTFTNKEKNECKIINSNIIEYKNRCDDHFSDIMQRMHALKVESVAYYNSAATFCHLMRFQIAIREFRLLGFKLCSSKADKPSQRVSEETIETIEQRDDQVVIKTKKITGGDPIKKPNQSKNTHKCIKAEYRTALQMILYLGELIRAQNYIEKPFIPEVLIGAPIEGGGYDSILVPLFEVKRGAGYEGQAAITVQHDGEVFYVPKPKFGDVQEARSLQALDLVLATTRATTKKSDTPKQAPTVRVEN